MSGEVTSHHSKRRPASGRGEILPQQKKCQKNKRLLKEDVTVYDIFQREYITIPQLKRSFVVRLGDAEVGRELVQLSPSLGTFFPTASKKKLWQSNLAMENGPFDDWSMISIVVFHSKFSAYHKHDGPQNPGRCDRSNLRTSRKTLRCLVNPFMVAIGMHTSTLRFSTPQISPITTQAQYSAYFIGLLSLIDHL